MNPSELSQIEKALSKKYALLKRGTFSSVVALVSVLAIGSSAIAYLAAGGSTSETDEQRGANRIIDDGPNFGEWIYEAHVTDKDGYWEFTESTVVQHHNSGKTATFPIAEINPKSRSVSFRNSSGGIWTFKFSKDLKSGDRFKNYPFEVGSK